jgi:hypothetical protein
MFSGSASSGFNSLGSTTISSSVLTLYFLFISLPFTVTFPFSIVITTIEFILRMCSNNGTIYP